MNALLDMAPIVIKMPITEEDKANVSTEFSKVGTHMQLRNTDTHEYF